MGVILIQPRDLRFEDYGFRGYSAGLRDFEASSGISRKGLGLRVPVFWVWGVIAVDVIRFCGV